MIEPTRLRVTQEQFEKLIRLRRGICTACWSFAAGVTKDESEVQCEECHEYCVQGVEKARGTGNLVIVATEEESDW